MIALLVILASAFFLFRLLGGAPQLGIRRHRTATETSSKIDDLTSYASRMRRGNNYRAAEKAYLQILKIDHRHVPTYSRLGTLYSAMKNGKDAIECFQIAAQLSPDGSTYYNLGLAQFESRNYEKTVEALEKSIMFEPSVQRYVALAKAFGKLGDGDQTLHALEQAAALDSSTKVLWLLVEAYEAAERSNDALEVYERIRTANPKDPRLKAVRGVSAKRAAAKASRA